MLNKQTYSNSIIVVSFLKNRTFSHVGRLDHIALGTLRVKRLTNKLILLK